MKTRFNLILTGIAALGLAMMTLPARAQNVVAEIPLTNTIATMNAGLVSGLTTNVYAQGNGAINSQANGVPTMALPQGSDLYLLIDSYTAAGTGLTNGANTLYFNYGLGNSNWTTTYPLSLSWTNNGPTNVGIYYFVNRTNFAGFDHIRCDKGTTGQTNPVYTRVFAGYPAYQH